MIIFRNRVDASAYHLPVHHCANIIGDLQLARLIERKKRLFFKSSRFIDAVNWRGVSIGVALEFKECVFEEMLDLRGAKFSMSIKFTKCVFKKGVTMEGVWIKGSLDLSFCTIYYPPDGENSEYQLIIDRPEFEPPPPFRTANLSGINIEGHLYARMIKIYGSLDMGHARINGGVFMEGAQIGLGRFGGRFYLRQARIEGDVEMSPYFDPNWTPIKADAFGLGEQPFGALYQLVLPIFTGE